jgi:hypothetical protein
MAPAPVYESKVLRKDGTKRWIEFRTVPIEYEGRRAILGNLLDITTRKDLEIEIVRNNRELTAINGIMEKCLSPQGDLDTELAEALTHVLAGIVGAELGGIFLMGSSGLELRKLVGSVEDLIKFTSGVESSLLLGNPKSQKCTQDATRIWITAPIICSGRANGAMVIACREPMDPEALSFLERASITIGYLLENAKMPPSLNPSPEPMTSASQDGLKSPVAPNLGSGL